VLLSKKAALNKLRGKMYNLKFKKIIGEKQGCLHSVFVRTTGDAARIINSIRPISNLTESGSSYRFYLTRIKQGTKCF